MDDEEKQRLLALAQQLRQQTYQESEAPEFDYDAKIRLGHMIGRAVLDGSEYAAYPAVLL
jgi:hypothetical protein